MDVYTWKVEVYIHIFIWNSKDNQHKVIVIIHEFKLFESFIYDTTLNMGITIAEYRIKCHAYKC